MLCPAFSPPMRSKGSVAIRVAALLSLLLWLSLGHAHFRLNVNIRIVHVEHLQDGARLYFRVPTPYVLAQELGHERADGTRAPAPYTYNRMSDDGLMHYLDTDAVRDDPIGLGAMVASGHQLLAGDQALEGTVKVVRVYPADMQPPFATLLEAQSSFRSPAPNYGERELFVGDTVTDVVVRYVTAGPLYRYSLTSSLEPGLEDQDKTANLLLDHFPGGTQVFRATGLLTEPVVVTRSALAAAWTFIVEGVRHILEGYDHVLFVICLTIGAGTIGGLLWRVTGFTLGHSVTLAGGFFGLAPDASWFVPAVETGIALSIIYVAIIALAQRQQRSSFILTAGIGLLHGLGFSFLLREILQINAPNLWQSLLAFNVGVELGQIALVLVIWALMLAVQRIQPTMVNALRWVVAVPCIAIAGIWTGERLVMLAAAA